MSLPAVPTDESATLRCARHPATETVLRCGRCDTPICPKCLVSAPVGARCPSCAQVKRLVLLVKPAEMARAAAYGIGVGAIGVVIASVIPFLGLLGYAIVGFGVGEAVSIGANRKRARELGPLAVACLFVGYELGMIGLVVVLGGQIGPGMLIGPILALRSMIGIGLLIGALLAWMRVR
jgi:hypothetical protein